MNRTVVKLSDFRRRGATLWLLALVIVAMGAGLTWRLVSEGRSTLATDELVIPARVESVAGLRPGNALRPSDAYSVQLHLLRQQAAAVAGRDAATAYALSLETLAQAGREAYVNSRLPTTANGYIDYLDNLRRQGQSVQNARAMPADANEFSKWLDELRRMGQ